MIINSEILDALIERAKKSDRLRMNYDLRNSDSDHSQRMLNAIEPSSIIPIHRHQTTSETVVILKGHAQELLYDQSGQKIVELVDLIPGGETIAVNIPLGQWHTIRSMQSGTVILECKDGMFAPMSQDDVIC